MAARSKIAAALLSPPRAFAPSEFKVASVAWARGRAMRDLARSYGDILLSVARWDVVWEENVGRALSRPIPLYNRAESELREAARGDGRREDALAIRGGVPLADVLALERAEITLLWMATARNEAERRCVDAALEGGDRLRDANRERRAAAETLEGGLADLAAVVARIAHRDPSLFDAGLFDAAVSGEVWAVRLLARFGAYPVLDGVDPPRVRRVQDGSPLRAGDVVTAVGREGEPLAAVGRWEDVVARLTSVFRLEDGPGLVVEISRDGETRTIAAPSHDGSAPFAPSEFRAVSVAEAQRATVETLASLYGDVWVALAHADAVWEERVGLPVDATVRGFAAVRNELVGAAFVPAGFGEIAFRAGAGSDAVAAVGRCVRALEKLASERDPYGSACVQSALEGGKPLEDAHRARREDVERTRKAVDRLVRAIASLAKAARIDEDAFLARVPADAWAVLILERFGALPDLDRADVPTVRVALQGSALRTGDVVTGVSVEGHFDHEVESWEAVKARFLDLLRGAPDARVALRIRRAGGERTVVE